MSPGEESGGVAGLLNVHPEVDDIDDDLSVALWLGRPSSVKFRENPW